MKPEMQRKLRWLLFRRSIGSLRVWPLLGLVAVSIALTYFFEPRVFVTFEKVQVIEYRTHQTKYGTKPYAVVQTVDGRTLHMAGYPDRSQREGEVCARVTTGMIFGGTRLHIAHKAECT